jgi:hypothetical protein
MQGMGTIRTGRSHKTKSPKGQVKQHREVHTLFFLPTPLVLLGLFLLSCFRVSHIASYLPLERAKGLGSAGKGGC